MIGREFHVTTRWGGPADEMRRKDGVESHGPPVRILLKHRGLPQFANYPVRPRSRLFFLGSRREWPVRDRGKTAGEPDLAVVPIGKNALIQQSERHLSDGRGRWSDSHGGCGTQASWRFRTALGRWRGGRPARPK